MLENINPNTIPLPKHKKHLKLNIKTCAPHPTHSIKKYMEIKKL
jgi:hypothetical protein